MNIKRLTTAVTGGFAIAMAVPAFALAAAPVVTTTNFNTHSGTDYKGVSVGFNVAETEPVKVVKVELLDDNQVLVTNTGTPKLLTLINTSTEELTSPFVTFHGTFDVAADGYWNTGDWSNLVEPDTARITVDGIVVSNTTLTEPNDWTFETLLPVFKGENFNTHNGTDYKGVNVGWFIAGVDELKSVKVQLFDARARLLVTNVGNVTELQKLYAANTNKFSTPFITQGLTYSADKYWKFGEWSSYGTPARAVVTVNGETVTLTNLDTSTGGQFAHLLPAKPASKEDCKNGGWTGYYKNQGQCASEFAKAKHNKTVVRNENTVTVTNNNAQTATSGTVNASNSGSASSGDVSIVSRIRNIININN
jgi:hypothetical protein